MRHPYLIRLNEKEDWLDWRRDESLDGGVVEEAHDILLPEGKNQMYEFNDSYWYGKANYHEHTTGWETFFVWDGRIEVTVRGKRTYMDSGDVLCLPPWDPHQMNNANDPMTVWNGLYHGMGLISNQYNWNMIQRTNPEMMDDPEIKANYLGNKNNVIRENPVYAVDVPKEEIREIRTYEHPLALYTLPGLELRQFTGRWENDGLSEVWLADMKQGVKVNYRKYNPQADLFYVIAGEVRFCVAGEEFVAGERCVVKIPHYAPRSFEAISDAKMYDMGGATHWMDLLEDMTSLKMLSPDKYADKAYVAGVAKRHECYLAKVEYNGEVIFENEG
jgi:quercetin dioxygenase-like cupin family protein